MISVQQALDHYKQIEPLKRLISLPLERAYGHTLARDLRSCISLPPMRQSAMDGYAVRRVDLLKASPNAPIQLPIQQSIAAGSWPQPLKPETAARIFTGAPVPAGADCIEIQENVDSRNGHVSFRSSPVIGANIREPGEELSAGQVILKKGQRLDAQTLSVAANAGHGHLPCRDHAKVAIIVTGNELVAPGQPRGPADVYESNGCFLQNLVRQQYAECHSLQRVGDNEDQLSRAIAAVLPHCDMLLISGGASVGEHDHSRSATANNGINEVFWKVAQKPGKPLSFGYGPKGQPVFVLPGNPASVHACSMVHVRTALTQLQGQQAPHCVQGTLTNRVAADSRRERLLRVAAKLQNGSLKLTPLAHQASHMSSNLVQTQAIARIPPGQNLAPGSLVSVWLFGDSGGL